MADTRPEAVIAFATEGESDASETLDALADELRLSPLVRLSLKNAGARDWTRFDEALAGNDPVSAPVRVDVDAPALVLFTSGTTSRPKGVVHSARTLLAEARQTARTWGLNWRDRGYLPLPIAHIAGIQFGLVIPAYVGASLILSRMTSLDLAAEEIVGYEVTYANGTAKLLPRIARRTCDHREKASLRLWSSGGSAVSKEMLMAGEAIGLRPFRLYGMTECPSVTLSSPLDDKSTRLDTDGRIAADVECVAVDPETREVLPPGSTGELRIRAPEQLLGYLSPADTERQIDRNGYFYSGDLGSVDENCRVLVSGRLRDIINRGGEKFSARDIEEVLRQHPSVEDVAVVASPDERYGEVPAAFVVVAPGHEPASGTALSEFLASRGMARQKTPVLWRHVASLPTTPNGKIRRNLLRDELWPAPADTRTDDDLGS
jgi:acyl-CoA synthetase